MVTFWIMILSSSTYPSKLSSVRVEGNKIFTEKKKCGLLHLFRGWEWGGETGQGSRSKSICVSVQFSSVPQSCPTLRNPMNRSTPGLPVHHKLPEFTETHVHWVGDGIQPSHPLLSPSPPAPNPSQHQSLFQWVNSSHEVAKVLRIHFSFL